jgi:hypothetical protein
MTDLDDLHYFLDIFVTHFADELFLYQKIIHYGSPPMCQHG